jgi:anti-anti-sigma factor
MRLFMTVTIATSASHLTTRYGNPVFECGGAHIRAQCRHLATVVTIRGEIDTVNVDRISDYTRHFILAKQPLVLDLSGVNSFAAAGISLLYTLEDDCRTAGVQWTLVASHAVIEQLRNYDGEAMFPFARSAHEALHNIADVIARRRQLLLPLIRKSA